MFELAVGCPPVDDDLERCNCDQHDPKDPTNTHWMCGWDVKRGMPRFVPGQSKAVRYLERVGQDRYERVFLFPIPTCRNHSTVVCAGGQQLVVHNSQLMNPFNRILTHHHPHQE
jgi:hypothetical protein